MVVPLDPLLTSQRRCPGPRNRAPRTLGDVTRTRTSRRRAGCTVGLVAALVVVAGGGLLADRVTHGLAEDMAADAVSSRLDAADLDVTIDGFPFLTQALRGTLDDVQLTAPAASLQGLQVADLHVTATDVAVRGERGAEHVRATATVPTATLEALLRERTGWDLTLTADDAGTLTAGGAVVGLPVAVGLTLAPAGADGLTATITSASLGGLTVDAGALPDGLAQRLADVDVTDQLPAGARVTDATVRADGLHLVVEVDDVTLDSL